MKFEIFDHMEEATEKEVQRLMPLVPKQRSEQAMRYKHVFGQFCCLKSWVMLKELMASFNFQLSEFSYAQTEKPYVVNGPYFSISHCKEGIAVAVNESPIGIDIESIRHADADMVARTMNTEEQQQIRNDRDFIHFWTRKEAVVKALGTGITSFEQIQNVLSEYQYFELSTFEHDKYIYSIAINNKS